MVLNDGKITVNTVDLSAYIKSFEWSPIAALHENTPISVTAVTREGGNTDNTLTIEFYQNMEAAKVYATLWPLIGVSTAIKIELDESEALSATNPEFQFNAILEGFPIGGAAGDVMMTSVTFQGNGAITLDTTP